MKRILSVVLALALLMSLAAVGAVLPVSASTGVVYSGLPTEINAEGTQTIGDVTISRSVGGTSTLNYNSETNVIDVTTANAQADIKISYPANISTGGTVYYIYEFKTGGIAQTLRLRAAWEGNSPVTYTIPGGTFAANKNYNLIIGYNTQTAEITLNINGTKSVVPSTSLTSGGTALTPEIGIDSFILRFFDDGASATVTNISVIKDTEKSGYGTYFSGIANVKGTAKIENGITVYGHTSNTSTKVISNNGNNTWNYNLGATDTYDDAMITAAYPFNNSQKGIAYAKFNLTVGSKDVFRFKIYIGNVEYNYNSLKANTSYEVICKYELETGKASLAVNGNVVKNDYSFTPSTGISKFAINMLASGTVTLNNVEVGISKIPGTEYGTYMNDLSDVAGSGSLFSKSNMDGASFTASYAASATSTTITKEGSTLKYADNDTAQFGGEITSKLLFPATSAYEKNGFLYYEYVVSFTGAPASVYLDIIPASGTISTAHKVCLFIERDGKIYNNTNVGSGNLDDTGAKDYTIGIAYEVSTGNWCIMVDGTASPLGKMNTTVAGTTIEKISAADGIQGVQMRYFGNCNGNNSSVVVKDATISFCPYDNEQSIGEIELDKEAGTASIEIIKNAFGSKIDNSVKFMIASYTENRLEAINYEEITLKAGKRTYTIAIGDKNGGTEMKAFLWNNEYTPLRYK